jgi:pimeloyl-ACP methyl ester carboxylesterase
MTSHIQLSKPLSKLICLGFAVTWVITLVSGLGIMYQEKLQMDQFFEQEQITRFNVKVPTQDGQKIAAIVMMKNQHLTITNYSIPTILFIPGANNQKNNNFNLKIQAVKLGFAVIAMEQRGHGESSGYFSLYGYEFSDVSDVITYASLNFPQLNSSNIGLVGMSLGGGSALGAQALDDRIYVSSIYHPAANLTSFFETIGVHPGEYFGFLPGMKYPYTLPLGVPDWTQIKNDTWYNRSAINLVTPENTKNLLLLHGSLDDMLQPYMTEDIVRIVDPLGTRNDIQFILREGLGHGQNEEDLLSFKYTMTWFRHFFMNSSIDITNLDLEAGYLDISPLIFPQTGNYAKLFEYSTLFLLIFLFCLCYLILYPKAIKEDPSNVSNLPVDRITVPDIKKQLIIKTSIVLVGYIFGGLVGLFRNPSIIYGVFFYPSIPIFPLLIILPYIQDRKKIFDDFSKQHLIEFVFTLLVFGFPFLLWAKLSTIGGILTINRTASPGIRVGLSDILLFASIFAMPFLFMRDVPKKFSLLLLPITFIGTLLVALFIPVPPLALLSLSGSLLLVIVGFSFAVLNFVIYHIFLFLQKYITRNIPATLLVLGIIVAVFIWFRFMRIF